MKRFLRLLKCALRHDKTVKLYARLPTGRTVLFLCVACQSETDFVRFFQHTVKTISKNELRN